MVAVLRNLLHQPEPTASSRSSGPHRSSYLADFVRTHPIHRQLIGRKHAPYNTWHCCSASQPGNRRSTVVGGKPFIHGLLACCYVISIPRGVGMIRTGAAGLPPDSDPDSSVLAVSPGFFCSRPRYLPAGMPCSFCFHTISSTNRNATLLCFWVSQRGGRHRNTPSPLRRQDTVLIRRGSGGTEEYPRT